MPYDPALPADHSPLVSAEMRGQFQGLKALIDAIQQITAVQVDSVTTLNPGDNATASAALSGTTVHFAFAIPRGDAGPQGPPFANALVDGVTTLPPGNDATVQVSFDGTAVHFQFAIPRGSDGGTGAQGIQGPPGEVTNADLNNAIATTSANSNVVGTLGLTVSDPPTQGEMQSIANKLDELILALRR